MCHRATGNFPPIFTSKNKVEFFFNQFFIKKGPLTSFSLSEDLALFLLGLGNEPRSQSYDRELQRQRCKFLQRQG
jgi:hypothetical protein